MGLRADGRHRHLLVQVATVMLMHFEGAAAGATGGSEEEDFLPVELVTGGMLLPMDL